VATCAARWPCSGGCSRRGSPAQRVVQTLRFCRRNLTERRDLVPCGAMPYRAAPGRTSSKIG
jgi:hypothetical protein